ncbi:MULTISPECIES: dihydroorotase [unclassified Thioalkalivibrio]|uniref:dihydroorotase n=1 Tax=unclassified Thioalkalivibrio TaxID=2621013 RepID=UPI000371C3F1|nr:MULTISPECIES: dihydroorotase [unclassified Thioalkalivibrio]
MNRLTLTRPDDWHLHLRDGDVLATVLPDTARRFRRAIIMPNLKPPVTTVEAAAEYRDRILAALPEEADFEPLMTLYLTEGTTPGMIDAAKASGFVHGVKLYPAGATTNAASGVTDIRRCYPVFEAMQRVDLPLLIHGEVTDPDVDIFDREAVFIERHLEPLIRDFPELRVVLEHITTESAVQFIQDGPANVGSTITPQHLLYNRNALFAGGMRPHHFCLPILKRERHRKALLDAATSGHPRFFLGTDSAPHPRHAKESACGCAGIYSAHAAIELYAEAFAAADALDRLEGFASHFGPDFYKLPRNTDKLTLERSPWTVPEAVLFGHDPGVPLRAGETIAWQLA